MKEWFKYENGFVNIDAENLYLTNSGNWSETAKLEEKTSKSRSANSMRRGRINFFFWTFCFLALCLVIYTLGMSKGRIGILVLLVVAAYQLYRYFQHDMGVKYRIPLDKISEIRIDGSKVTIVFTDGERDESEEELTNVEQKGLVLFEKLGQKNAIGPV